MNEKFFTLMAEVFEVSPEVVNVDFELNKDNWDSLAVLSTIAIIDEVYGITIPGTKLISSSTIGDLLELVQTELNQK